MKWDRDKTLLDILRFAETGGRGAWNRVKRSLFWEESQEFLATRYELETEIEDIRAHLEEFLERNFLQPIRAWHEGGMWEGVPGDEVHRLASQFFDEGRARNYATGIDIVRKEYPALWKAYNAADQTWLSESLPWPKAERRFHCDGETFRYSEPSGPEGYPLKDNVIQRVISLLAMPPGIPLSKFYKCEECQKWSINTRKSRKHWFCSKKCYDRAKKREERNTPEGREAYRKRQRGYYRAKVLAD